MAMEKINADIKAGTFEKVYLLTGEEGYLIQQYQRRLSQSLLGDGDAMNLSVFEGKGISVSEVTSLADTLPFFAERRVILVINSGWFDTSSEEMATYIDSIPETTVIVFAEKDVDKRKKLFKEVKKLGYVASFPRQNEAVLIKWIGKKIANEGKTVPSSRVTYLLNKVGNDMQLISNEIEKLLCYTLEKKDISIEDIDAICISSVEDKIFEMMKCIARQEEKKALTFYKDLLLLKTPPLRILSMLNRQYKGLMEVKELQYEGVPETQMAKIMGVNPYAVKQYIWQVGAFTAKELRKSVEEGVTIEERIKTGRIKDVLGVELFIVAKSRRMEDYLD